MPISQIVTNSIADGNVTTAKISSLAQVIKPAITSPANNATGILDNQLFTATSYLSLYGRSQANAEWQISTSPTFAFINVNSTITGSNNQFQANNNSGLVVNTIHYARVRYSDDANNSSEYSNTVQFTTATAFTIPINFLVIGGGGGGAANRGAGGGGAGGYRTSIGTSGGPSSAESRLNLLRSTNYTVTVGGGGSGGDTSAGIGGTNGSSSIFSTITSAGGGVGGSNQNPFTPTAPFNGAAGGSGGGGGAAAGGSGNGGSGTSGQGNPGGNSTATSTNAEGGAGGGGAGAAGTPNSAPGSGTVGGNGISSSPLFGPAVTRGGGGGGAGWSGGAPGGTGGGGTGRAGPADSTNPGTTNTGGGGGAGGGQPSSGGSGGSGIVILHYPTAVTLSNPGGGLTYTTATVSGNTVATFTAGTGNVSWS